MATKCFQISLKFNFLSNKQISRLVALILGLPGTPEGGRGFALSYSVTATLLRP